jgi:hypothetical protein
LTLKKDEKDEKSEKFEVLKQARSINMVRLRGAGSV